MDTSIYVLQWALLHWDKLEPAVQCELEYAYAEGITPSIEHFQRRLATRIRAK